MNRIILVLALIFNLFMYSQSISKNVIGSSGNMLTNSNLKVSFTIGEPVVGLMTAGGNQIGNGYYPAMNLQVLSIEDNVIDVNLKVYPNPTSQLLYLSHPDIKKFEITIVDLNGKFIYQDTIHNNIPLDISNYSQGIYLVTVEIKNTNKKNTYRIIKN